ncbi:hypothetical protein SAMN04488118_107206 [Epibacterium ulvae]|uniref:Uncharacterized protein n=1 Tax=Epibacterium ulvae TaxID=1156985 RepID=A0A1G5R2G3_9RHOB|nr:hypothetical protein SAMN04488118_107206 [Epibacterium ulvae]
MSLTFQRECHSHAVTRVPHMIPGIICWNTICRFLDDISPNSGQRFKRHIRHCNCAAPVIRVFMAEHSFGDRFTDMFNQICNFCTSFGKESSIDKQYFVFKFNDMRRCAQTTIGRDISVKRYTISTKAMHFSFSLRASSHARKKRSCNRSATVVS